MTPFGVVLLLILLVAVAFITARMIWLKKRAEAGVSWPTTEATVQSGEEFITSGRGGDITVLCFTFSYVVNGEYFSGRFELLPNSDSHDLDAVLSRMKGRKFLVHFDPANPKANFVADKKMESCEVNNY